MGNVQDARREMTKTKEQLEEEKKISLSIRIKPLELDGMDGDALKEKASELWEVRNEKLKIKNHPNLTKPIVMNFNRQHFYCSHNITSLWSGDREA